MSVFDLSGALIVRKQRNSLSFLLHLAGTLCRRCILLVLAGQVCRQMQTLQILFHMCSRWGYSVKNVEAMNISPSSWLSLRAIPFHIMFAGPILFPISQLAFYVNLHRAVIDLRRMLTGLTGEIRKQCVLQILVRYLAG